LLGGSLSAPERALKEGAFLVETNRTY